MPRQRIDAEWRTEIRTLTANNPKWGPGRIEKELAKIGAKMAEPRNDYPSQRTIGREQEAFRALSEPQRAEYLAFRWPESMMDGLLPWEASAAALELLKYVMQEQESDAKLGLQGEVRHPGQPLVRRPSVRLVRWFWRITIAAPARPVEERFGFAWLYDEWERNGSFAHLLRRAEHYLVSDEGKITISTPALVTESGFSVLSPLVIQGPPLREDQP